MAYSVIKGTRANPQRTAVTGTPIRTEGAWPLYYGTASPYVRTSTSPITALSVDTETTDTANTVEGTGNYGAGYETDPTGQRTNVDTMAQGILDEKRGIGTNIQGGMLAMQGPVGLAVALSKYGIDRTKAYNIAQEIDALPTFAQQIDAYNEVLGKVPDLSIAGLNRGGSPIGGYDSRSIGPGQEGDAGINKGPSPTGITDTSGYASSTGYSMDAGINKGPSQDMGDFDGAFGDFGFSGLGDSGGQNAGVGAGTGSMGGGYAGGYGMDAGIGRGSGIGGYDSDEGGMGTGSGGLGGLG